MDETLADWHLAYKRGIPMKELMREFIWPLIGGAILAWLAMACTPEPKHACTPQPQAIDCKEGQPK
jgi:hypothetical protein